MEGRSFARFGSLCAITGGVLAVVFNLLHPRASNIDGGTVAELKLISESDIWLFVHLALVVALLLIFPGLVAISRSLIDGGAGSWGRVALYAAVVGNSIGLITLAIDGVAMKEITDLWVAAGGGSNDELVAANVVSQVGIGIFDIFIVVLFGLTPLLFGVAALKAPLYPRWLGGLSMAGGVLGLVVGVAQSFTGLNNILTNVLFPVASLAFTAVIIGAGVTLWRASQAAEVGDPVPAAT